MISSGKMDSSTSRSSTCSSRPIAAADVVVFFFVSAVWKSLLDVDDGSFFGLAVYFV